MKELIHKIRKLRKAEKFNEIVELIETIPKQYMTSDMWVLRGVYMQMGDGTAPYTLEDIKESFKCAIALNPYNADAIAELGWFMYAIEDNAVGAEPYFRKAVKLLAKDNYEALRGVAECLSETKGESAALDFIKTSRLSPSEKRKMSSQIRGEDL